MGLKTVQERRTEIQSRHRTLALAEPPRWLTYQRLPLLPPMWPLPGVWQKHSLRPPCRLALTPYRLIDGIASAFHEPRQVCAHGLHRDGGEGKGVRAPKHDCDAIAWLQ